MVTKQLYLSPDSELMVIRFEGNFLSEPGSGFGATGRAGDDLTESDEHTYSY